MKFLDLPYIAPYMIIVSFFCLLIGYLIYRIFFRKRYKATEGVNSLIKSKTGVFIFEAVTYFLIAISLAVSSSYTSNITSENSAFIVVTFALILASLQTLYKCFDVVFKAMHFEMDIE